MRDRLLLGVAVVLLLVAFGIGRDLYQWYAYRTERETVLRLRAAAVNAGAELVVLTRRAEAMRRTAERADSVVGEDVAALRRYERYVRGSTLPALVYPLYERDWRRYQRAVAARDAALARFGESRDRLRALASRYNLLADSIRAVAARMGDPYYHVPLPVEAAAERGLLGKQR